MAVKETSKPRTNVVAPVLKNGTVLSSQPGRAPSKTVDEAVVALSAIPADKAREMLLDFQALAEENSVAAIIDTVTKWLLIGECYRADPERAQENPLLSVIGVFKNDPDFDDIMKRVHEYRDLAA